MVILINRVNYVSQGNQQECATADPFLAIRGIIHWIAENKVIQHLPQVDAVHPHQESSYDEIPGNNGDIGLAGLAGKSLNVKRSAK
jgi:hypothetical protein